MYKRQVNAQYAEEIIRCVEKYGPYIIIMPDVAMPHSQEGSANVNKTAIGFMKLEKPVSFDPGDPEKDATLFFTLAASDSDQHMANMVRLSEMLMMDGVADALKAARTPEDLLTIQEKYLD